MHHPFTLSHVGIFLNESPVPRHSFASRTRDKTYSTSPPATAPPSSFASRTRDKTYGSICRRFTEYPELLHPHTYARLYARDSAWEDRLRYVGNVVPCTPAARAHVCGVPGSLSFSSETRRPERGRSGWNVRRIDRPTGPPFVCPSYIPKRLTLTGRLRGARRSDNAVRLWITLSITCRYLSISIPQRPKMASKNKEAVDNSQKRDADGMPMNHDGQ